MIEFHTVQLNDKPAYERRLFDGKEHGSECSFANRYLWGQQQIYFSEDHVVCFSQFEKNAAYSLLLGQGDQHAMLDAILRDAEERGLRCRISGLDAETAELLEVHYPGQFQLLCDRDSFDYVYLIDDLADLKGRRYQRKRNHFNHFRSTFPDYVIEPLGEANIPAVFQMLEAWYREKLSLDPNQDYRMEQRALAKALRHYQPLEMEGLVLRNGSRILAFTMGSRLSEDTFDVHFEKACMDADGAYAAINCEFARYIRDKYPQIRYLNREEDMGLEGLRKAKERYRPHHMVEKCRAAQAAH